jgi:hypothetical protein
MIPTNNSVEDLIYFKNKLLTNSPFSAIRPSDGEYLVMTGNDFSNIDNWHYDGKSCLNQDLRDAIQMMTKLENAFIGVPCKGCGPTLDKWYTETFNIPEEKKTYANVFVNKNWKSFMDLFTENKLPFHYIGPYKSNNYSLNLISKFEMDEFLVNDWESKKEHVILQVKKWATDKSGIFIFSAGPISKILIPILVEQNPSNIYLDVGSAFDLYMKGSTNREYATPGSYYSNIICNFKSGHN